VVRLLVIVFSQTENVNRGMPRRRAVDAGAVRARSGFRMSERRFWWDC
jgi:hypothetical protein